MTKQQHTQLAAVLGMAVLTVTIVFLLVTLSQSWKNERFLDATLNQRMEPLSEFPTNKPNSTNQTK